MSLKEELESKIKDYMTSKYEVDEGYTIPNKPDIKFGAHTKRLKHAVVLYADIRGSRDILSNNSAITAARVHKSFLYVAAKCIRNEDGHLRSFNGDSVLCFFNGEDAAKRAVRAAMKLKYAILEILNPIVKEKTGDRVDFGIGIGQGEVHVVKSGIPGEEIHQDLIWIGWPTYHAFEYGNKAKSPKNIWVSKNIFNEIKDDTRIRYSDGNDMWVYSDEDSFTFGKVRVYKTSYYWSL